MEESFEDFAMKLRVVLTPESDGGYSAEVPSLPGCFSEGDTRSEALANIRDAAVLWLEAQHEIRRLRNGIVESQELCEVIEL
jgi:predicted RNase H-like HicB family nuclease